MQTLHNAKVGVLLHVVQSGVLAPHLLVPNQHADSERERQREGAYEASNGEGRMWGVRRSGRGSSRPTHQSKSSPSGTESA